MNLAQIVVLLVAVQRLAELVHARRNTRRLLAEGGIEVGAGHYPLIVATHAAWLAAQFFTASPGASVNWWLLGLYGLLQVGRLWVMVSLGRYWTTRIITLPQAPLIPRGPYRLCRHPNYMIVAAEIAVLPLAFGAWWIAVAFSVINGALLAVRIRAENEALATRRPVVPE